MLERLEGDVTSAFKIGGHWIRTVGRFVTEAGTEEPIGFIATDLARAMGHQSAGAITRRLEPDQRGGTRITTGNGLQFAIVLSEIAFLGLILRSRNPEAKALRDAVNTEVLPRLRNQGYYGATPAPVEAQA